MQFKTEEKMPSESDVCVQNMIKTLSLASFNSKKKHLCSDLSPDAQQVTPSLKPELLDRCLFIIAVVFTASSSAHKNSTQV